MARKNLVDGSLAYKERKFEVAEDLFRRAAARDPKGETEEGRTAQVFLARTLHSRYIGNRQKTELAEEAIAEYKKALALNKNDQSSYKAVASLFENLQRPDEWKQWVTARSTAADIKPEYRAEALTSLAARQNTCANEVSDTTATKKTIQRDGKDVFQFVKPADNAEFERMKTCVDEGSKLIEQAIALEPETVKNAGSLNPKAMSDADLKTTLDVMRPFESARSYRASLIIQRSRVAEMEGNNAERDRLKAEADTAKAAFTSLADSVKSLQAEIDARKAAAEEAENANKAANK
jgi:tetratricopeptide (TPR) repeat protein